MTINTALKAVIIPCDDRCMWAQGDDCDCFCGGKNHRQGHRLTAIQRTVLRTVAGRRITPLTPKTTEWDLANAFAMLEDQGMTRKDIAAQFRVSAPVVRRYITRLLATLEMAEEQAAAAVAA